MIWKILIFGVSIVAGYFSAQYFRRRSYRILLDKIKWADAKREFAKLPDSIKTLDGMREFIRENVTKAFREAEGQTEEEGIEIMRKSVERFHNRVDKAGGIVVKIKHNKHGIVEFEIWRNQN